MVVYDPTLHSQLKALRQLQSITSKTVRRLNALNIPSSATDRQSLLEYRDGTCTPLDLPFPEEIFTPIIKLNVPETLRNAIRDQFTNHITALQLKCTTNYQQFCKLIPQTTQPAQNRRLREAYLTFYRRQCHVFMDTQLPHVMKEVAKLSHSGIHRDTTKTEFNHEYTPILESYFSYNAYPSLPDRLLLARKSMMTPRQIEVWFQNHRNRARKDGVTLRRISPHATSTFAFDKLVSHTPQVTALRRRSRSATVDTGSSDEDVSFEDREETLFSDCRPPHVFPTPYSAKPGDDPFSLDNQLFKLESSNWMRLPVARATQHSSTTVDDLAVLFSEMNVRASARPPRSSKLANQRKWASPVVLAPCTAPHPAVINPGYTSPLPANRTSDSCTWQKPSLRARKQLASRAQASYPSWAVPETPRRRKSPCLSRRVPSSPLNIRCFDTSPRSSSSTSSSGNSSFGSRSTSLSSLSSEVLDVIPTENSIPDLVDMAGFTFGNTNWDFNFSSPSQFLSSSLPQGDTSNLSQCLTLPDFVTMDLPGFTFFDS